MKSRVLRVKHSTVYRYDKPVTKSGHRLHLRPLQDSKQILREHTLNVSVNVPRTEYEDVFGNATTRFQIEQSYTELKIDSESTVEIIDTDPFSFAKIPIKRTFPLAWM